MTRGRVMFNKYNGRSRQVLMYAHREARKFQHNYIGTEHVLMGISEEGGRETGGFPADTLMP